MSCPSHEEKVARLKKIEGQVCGIVKMVESKRVCMDVLNQISAAVSALNAVRNEFVNGCISCCLQETFTTEDADLKEKRVQELMQLLKR